MCCLQSLVGARHPRIEADGTIRLQVFQPDIWNPCLGLRAVLEELKEIMFGGVGGAPPAVRGPQIVPARPPMLAAPGRGSPPPGNSPPYSPPPGALY